METYSEPEKDGQQKVPSEKASQKKDQSNIRYSLGDKEGELMQMMSKSNAGSADGQLMNMMSKGNSTGLPNTLKDNVESMSGENLDDVKVHYNSSEPAKVGAHAFAQGSNIHLGPGQEQHLPHEAWHTVQQKQGRVTPTKQLKGKKINDQDELEKEADVMGEKAANGSAGPPASNLSNSSGSAQNIIQRYPIDPFTSSLTQEYVQTLSDYELEAMLQELRAAYMNAPDSALAHNMQIIEDEVFARTNANAAPKKKKTSKKPKVEETAPADEINYTPGPEEQNFTPVEEQLFTPAPDVFDETEQETEPEKPKTDYDRFLEMIGTTREDVEAYTESDENAERKAEKIYDCFNRTWQQEQEALNELKGTSLSLRRKIRSTYNRWYSKKLEIRFRDDANSKISRAAYRLLAPTMALIDKLEYQVTWSNAKEHVILEILKNATKKEIEEFRKTNFYSRRMWLKGFMNDDEYYKARMFLLGGKRNNDEHYQIVKEYIISAESIWGDDEKRVYNSIMELNKTNRENLWLKDREIFSFIDDYKKYGEPEPDTEFHSIKILCMGSEAEMLKERMYIAVDGAGTDDPAVKNVMERVKNMEDGEERKKLLSGSESSSHDKYEGRSMLELMDGDVRDSHYLDHIQTAGMDRYTQAKEMILRNWDFLGLTMDEDMIYQAFNLLPNQEQRDQLASDTEVKAVLGYLDLDEQKILSHYQNGDTFEIAKYNVDEAFGLWNTQEVGLIDLIASLSIEDRIKFAKDPKFLAMIEGAWSLNDQEKAIIRSMIPSEEDIKNQDKAALQEKYGAIPTEKALDYALGGSFDGTIEEMLDVLFEKMHPKERFKYRLGYYLEKCNGEIPEEEIPLTEQNKAREAFLSLNKRLLVDLGGKYDNEYDTYLDKLLGFPFYEYKQNSGKKMISGMLEQRVKDKEAIREHNREIDWRDKYDIAYTGITNLFTQGDADVSREAGVSFSQFLEKAKEDGLIDPDEISILAAQHANFNEKYDDYVQSVEFVANVGATVAATAAAIAVTALTFGTGSAGAGPALSGFLSGIWGKAAAASIASSVVGVATKEGMAGTYYDPNLKDAVGFGIDGLTSVVALRIMGSASAAFSHVVGKGGKASASTIAKITENAGKSSVSRFVSTMKPVFKQGVMEGALVGLMNEAVFTAMDANTWSKGVWHTLSTFGKNLIKGTLEGAALGGGGALIFGAGNVAINAVVRKQFKKRLLQRITSNPKFSLTHTDEEITAIIQNGRALKLTDDEIDDLLFVSSRDAKRLSATELVEQMDNWVNVIRPRGYPFRFQNKEQFEQFSRELKEGLDNIGVSSKDVRVQGSSLRNPEANDVDLVAIISRDEFDDIIRKTYKEKIIREGQVVDISNMNSKQLHELAEDIALNKSKYNRKAYDDFRYLMKEQIINAKPDKKVIKGLKQLKDTIRATYPNLNVENIAIQPQGSSFDLKPFINL